MANNKFKSEVKSSAKKVADKAKSKAKDKLQSALSTTEVELDTGRSSGNLSVVNGGISQIQNPYFVWVSLEFFGGEDDITYVLTQKDTLISIENEKFYFDTGGPAKCTISLMDYKGGYDLEKILLKKPKFWLQYGYTEGSNTQIQEYTVMSFSPSLEGGYSHIQVVGVSVGYESNKLSGTSQVYGVSEEQQIEDIRNKEFNDFQGSVGNNDLGQSTGNNNQLQSMSGTTQVPTSKSLDVVPTKGDEIDDFSGLEGYDPKELGLISGDKDGGSTTVSTDGSTILPSQGPDDNTPVYTEVKYPEGLISEIAKQVIEEAGWKVGKIERTKEVYDSKGMVKKFVRVGLTAMQFLKYELAPYAVSAETGAGGYVAIMHEKVGAKSNTNDDRTTEITVDFVPMVVNAVKGPNQNSTDGTTKYFFDVRTPRGATVSKIISFKPNVTKQVSSNGTSTTVESSNDAGASFIVETNVNQSSERLEPGIISAPGGTGIINSSSSPSELQAQGQAIVDYSFPTTFKADLEIMGNPDIKLLDVVEVNYIMLNGEAHHSSGQYVVLGVTDHINGGSYTTSVILGRGTDPEVYRERSEAAGQDAGGDIYGAPQGGYRGITVDGKSYDGRIDKALSYLVSMGISPMAASCIVGSWIQESTVNPNVNTPNDNPEFIRKYGADGVARGLNQWHENWNHGFGPKCNHPMAIKIVGKSTLHKTVNGHPGVGEDKAPYSNKDFYTQVWYFVQLAKGCWYFNQGTIQVWKGLNSGVMGTAPSRAVDARGKSGTTIWYALAAITGWGTVGRRGEYANQIWNQVKNQSPKFESSGLSQVNGVPGGVGGGPIIETSTQSSVQQPPAVQMILPAAFNQVTYPLSTNDKKITSPFGKRNTGIQGASVNHRGVDLSAPTGTPVLAFASGVVRRLTPVSAGNGGGNIIYIDHGSGFFTLYMHLNSFGCTIGQKVQVGQEIGKSGGSGKGSMSGFAPHLHFEMRHNCNQQGDGESFAPEAFFNRMGCSVSFSNSDKRKNNFKILGTSSGAPNGGPVGTNRPAPTFSGGSGNTIRVRANESGYPYTLHIVRTRGIQFATESKYALVGPKGLVVQGIMIEPEGPDNPTEGCNKRIPSGFYKLYWHSKSATKTTNTSRLSCVRLEPIKGTRSSRSGVLIHPGAQRTWSIGCLLPVTGVVDGMLRGKQSMLSSGGLSSSTAKFNELMNALIAAEGRWSGYGNALKNVGVVVRNL